jgi:t-SNARE complex subunit (syntaxin)
MNRMNELFTDLEKESDALEPRTEPRLSLASDYKAAITSEGALDEENAGVAASEMRRYAWTVKRKSSTGLVTEEVCSIDQVIAVTTNDLVGQITALVAGRLRCATEMDRSENETKLNQVLAQGRRLHVMALDHLKSLARENKEHADRNPNEDWGVAQMRQNIYMRFSSRLKVSIELFRASADSYKKTVEDESRRQLEQAGITDSKQIDEIIANGRTEQVLKSAVSGDLSDAIQALEQRHESIQHLTREILQVAQLFNDLAAVIDTQQQHLDHIESHIGNARDSVERGAVNLERGQKDLNCSRKSLCCIAAIVILVLVVIVAPSLVKILS